MLRDRDTNRPDSFEGIDRVFEARYFLTPGECNPEQRMPLTLLINRLIEVATLHANQIGVGFDFLVREHQTWVLSRVAVEMRCYPGVNEHYAVRTWVSSISRLFSERDFEIADGDGAVIGHARTVWAVIDTRTRSVGDISRIGWMKEIIPDKQSPVEKPSRPKPVAAPVDIAGDARKAQPTGDDRAAGEEPLVPQGYREVKYRFQYTDIDFNRHVNSSRYIELLLNQWSLDYHDANRLTRFEIAYIHEARYNEEVTLRLLPDAEASDAAEPCCGTPGAMAPCAIRAELVSPDGQPVFRALLRFSPR